MCMMDVKDLKRGKKNRGQETEGAVFIEKETRTQ